MPARFTVVPAAYVYLLRPGTAGGREVLLGLRQGTGFMDGHWASAVAGHVERGESVYDAAAREAREEVGVTDVALTPWCAMQRTRPTGDPVDERVDWFFVATAWAGEPRLLEPDKRADQGWFDLDALPDPLVAHERVVLDSIRAGIVDPILTHGF